MDSYTPVLQGLHSLRQGHFAESFLLGIFNSLFLSSVSDKLLHPQINKLCLLSYQDTLAEGSSLEEHCHHSKCGIEVKLNSGAVFGSQRMEEALWM